MFEGLDDSQIKGAIEALLFVSDSPVDAITIAEMLEIDRVEVTRVLDEMRLEREQRSDGVQLLEVAGGWRFYTNPVYDKLLEKYVLSWDTRKMSQAALEVLAIVAYGQPMTRAQISSIRGVNSDSVVNTLVERGIVRKAGELDAPGNPALYATTKVFLEKFGLSSCDELPSLEDYAPDEKTAQTIRERLGATREPIAPAMDFVDRDGGAREIGCLAGVDGAGEYNGVANRQADNVSAEGSMASLFGAVEKIDFDSLSFDMDSE